MAGDPVRLGDVIETAADGHVGIRLIDGTAFILSRNTRVVLDEFACDPDGISHAALFAVARGAFAFVAGRMARSGSLQIDTPVGSIRGRAYAGGFGTLSLTALTFAAMSEVQAADPNTTFLDDDTITYKDLEHGTFELWTKEAIPRHIIVDDPGQTIVLTNKGSSISVGQFTNSAARMEELRDVQQAVLANFAKGYNPNGSSSPPGYFDPPPLQPINYVQPGGYTTQASLPPLQFPQPPIEPLIIKPPPLPPALNLVTSPILIDTSVFDTFGASTGILAASSPREGATLTYGISGGATGNTVLNGVTYDVSRTGPYGTLYLNSATGAYAYVPNDDAVNALSAPTTESYTITVFDGTLSASQTFVIDVNGANDAAVISGKTTGLVIEAGGVTNATPGTQTSTGTLTDSDVDNPPNSFTPVSSTKSDKGYGSFTMTAAGVWTYTLDNTNATVQGLNANSTPLTDSFTVTTVDGTSQQITVTITGSNDAAVISGTKAGSVIEAGDVVNASPGLQITTGTLTDTDVDNAANTFIAVSSPKKSTGSYGSFTMTAAGVWTYTLDEANAAVQALSVGDTLTDTFTVNSIDGTSQVVTITIQGPMIAVTGTAPALALSETHLTAGSAPNAAGTTTSANFSTAFTSVQGMNDATISYALSITGGNGAASGLIDSQTGLADVLVFNGNTIEGHVGTTDGALAFTISVDPNTGLVTFTESRAVAHPFGTNPDGGEGVSLTAGIVNLTATVTDADGKFQTASRDLGGRLTITDDGPMIAPGTASALTLSEAHLTAGSSPSATGTTTSGSFSTAFTSVQGADGATISYALSITGGNGAASGLIDSQTGEADVLVLNGNTIEGHVGTTGGTLAFTITLNPTTGQVTFTEYRAVTQPFGTNPDGGEGVSLTAGIVNLTATITDKDGDFQTASLDLGSRLTITDDGPTIGSFDHATIIAQDNQVANGTFDVSFGADGDGAMHVAVHNGAVNGYHLATTDLAGGVTSVHVTGNGDDYTFYYTTHALDGGVALDAFFTDTSGTLSDPFFTLLINPDGTFTFDIDGVGFLQQTTVSGSDFGASSSGQPSLTAPDGLLVITGEFNGTPVHVKASNNGIAVGDSGLQMDQQETLLLTFGPEQTDVSFILTQWQGNGTARVVVEVLDGENHVHDFAIDIPKPSGDAQIVVKQTSDLALVDKSTFDSATSTYTLYAGSEFNQIGVSYDDAVSGNATFTVNDVTYSHSTIPSTDLLFDVTAVDGDGDSATNSLQVDLLGGPVALSTLTLASALSSPAPADVSGNTLTDTSTVITDNDPIAGISGSNTINDSTIIGGFGGDKPGGSNGNTLVYRAVAADSNSAKFDTIADFASNSHRINLAGFGALAFMALSPAATTVPPHTLAWTYDSTSNETIVYVNPTDQSLDIGDSDLLEFHLQGVASVQETDFVIQPTRAATAAIDQSIDPVLAAMVAGEVLTTGVEASDASVGASPVRDFRWTTADEGSSFHFADRVESTGSARLDHFGETRDHASEGDADATVTLISASPAELPRGHAAGEAHFAFDQGLVHASAAAMTVGDPAVTAPGHAIDHGGAVANAMATWELGVSQESGINHGQSQRDLHATSESGPPGQQNAALDVKVESAANHGQSQRDLHATSESGPPGQQQAALDVTADSAANHGQSQHDLNAASDSSLTPGDSFQFKSDMAASKHSKTIDLADVSHPASTARDGNAAGHGGLAAIQDEEPANLSLTDVSDHAKVAQQHAPHDLIV
jgi:VCBS repeat-containing protein